jgi:hypothetical protein
MSLQRKKAVQKSGGDLESAIASQIDDYLGWAPAQTRSTAVDESVGAAVQSVEQQQKQKSKARLPSKPKAPLKPGASSSSTLSPPTSEKDVAKSPTKSPRGSLIEQFTSIFRRKPAAAEEPYVAAQMSSKVASDSLPSDDNSRASSSSSSSAYASLPASKPLAKAKGKAPAPSRAAAYGSLPTANVPADYRSIPMATNSGGYSEYGSLPTSASSSDVNMSSSASAYGAIPSGSSSDYAMIPTSSLQASMGDGDRYSSLAFAPLAAVEEAPAMERASLSESEYSDSDDESKVAERRRSLIGIPVIQHDVVAV